MNTYLLQSLARELGSSTGPRQHGGPVAPSTHWVSGPMVSKAPLPDQGEFGWHEVVMADGTTVEVHNPQTINRAGILVQVGRHTRSEWTPRYDPWRHGGSYTDVRRLDGGCGCIASARHTVSGMFEIENPVPAGTVNQFRTRDAAARAEREIAAREWRHALAELDASNDNEMEKTL